LFNRVDPQGIHISNSQAFEDLPLAITFSLSAASGTVNVFVSLSARISEGSNPGESSVFYQVFLDDGMTKTPIPGSNAGGRVHTADAEGNAIVGNAIDLQVVLPAGTYTIGVQWMTGAPGESADINPGTIGMHGSLLIESCDGIKPPT